MNSLPTSDLATLAYAGIFLGVLVAFEGIMQVLSRSESNGEVRNRRMRMIAKGGKTKQMHTLLKAPQDQWHLVRLPLIGTLPTALRQAGVTVSPWLFLLGCVVAAVLVSAIAATRIVLPGAIGLGVVVSLGLPLHLVKSAGKRRKNKLVQQLPDALDLMARGLRVGHPLNATIATVASDMADPIASEFGIVVDQISYGDDLVNAFGDMATRLNLEDVRYLAVSVAIQHGTGGNLSEVLNTLSKVIRDRITMRKRIAAISSEGRLTSIFLSLLPLFILAATSITAPDYYVGVSDDPLFRPFAITVGCLIVSNYLVMRKLVNFRF